jgi:(E)-4-hydroxy-3-methylbut-2-enyl-diphosphate synthase
MAYCGSRFHTVRRLTREVRIGSVGVGGINPVRIQSMTTSDTQDVAGTVRQSIALAEIGCEIVRVTAPNVQAARCLKDIRAGLTAAGWGAVPLVADIHFLPQAAMEAVEHVEKVRVNPGNYADKKRFAVRDYSDADYGRELQRLHDAFSPLVKRSKELGRAMRIGTNHGSLSDRIMNRYGDTPLGMVESALEFLRIAESHGYKEIILSMKSSNPKVMIEAYRLLVERMDAEDMHYPLHLGVTEAGDGEDGRIKGSIGIGSLLLDGLGDTVRVSLTEDSVYEIPVAQVIADKAMSLWGKGTGGKMGGDSIDPYHFERRQTNLLHLAPAAAVGPEQPPRVVVRIASADLAAAALKELASPRLKDTPAEGLLVPVGSVTDVETLLRSYHAEPASVGFLVLEVATMLLPGDLEAAIAATGVGMALLRRFDQGDAATLAAWASLARRMGHFLVVDASPSDLESLAGTLRAIGDEGIIVTCSGAGPESTDHPVGAYRRIVEALRDAGSNAPIWIRNTPGTAVKGDNTFLSRLVEASFLTGSLLCDGVGNLISIETESDPARAARVCYNVLQGAGARISKAEFVACPSCGRTLFDLQTTTQRIRTQTAHLKGVKIAIMGCIVNGPGEMADADFGYVGGAPGKINLYVGKQCVQYNIPQADADARLIALIKEHKKWADPEPAHA